MKRFMESKIVHTGKVNEHVWKMTLEAPDMAMDAQPGQFINVYMDRGEMILPRPISIQDVDREKGTLCIMYQIAGKGTAYMSAMEAGKSVHIAGPMGNGFVYKNYTKLALIGGGIGTPPMYYTTKAIKQKHPGVEIRVYAGFRNKAYVILEDDFRALGVPAEVATDDGSHGFHGNALQALGADEFPADAIFACGPTVMLKHVAAYAKERGIPCQVSMEEHMACGIGACVGCAIPIKSSSQAGFEYQKVCKDGPVFDSEAVMWQ